MILQSVLSVSTQKEKLKELDYMRVIACIAVMIVHISATGVTDYIHGSFPNLFMIWLNRSLKFTTPIFIFLSGITGFYAYTNKEFKYLEFLKKRLPKVVIPYLIWCFIYYITYINMNIYVENTRFLIESILNGTMSYHLYFVIIIVQLYVLGPIFYNLVKKSKNRIITLVIAAIATAWCVEYLTFELADRVFLKYMFFYMLGIYVTLEYDKFTSMIKKYKILIILGYVTMGLIYAAVSYYGLAIYSVVWFVFCIVSIFFVYYIGVLLKDKWKQIYGFVKLFGQSSYYIYLMHPLILTIMMTITDNRSIFSVTERLIIYLTAVMLVTIMATMSYTLIKNKIKNKEKYKVIFATDKK